MPDIPEIAFNAINPSYGGHLRKAIASFIRTSLFPTIPPTNPTQTK